MDLEELRCISQVNDNFNDRSSVKRDYYCNEKEAHELDRPDPDLSLLTPCEFCNRTFVPASLNKHRRGCYKSWLKQKDRDSRMDREKNRYQTPIGYNGEKPILTIEQMLAKRRQRRLNWRMRHEEFMRAVHAARDYADAVASGNPLPPPPAPVMEPDLRQCPHCQRRFHEKAIERHLTRCKEQSMRNNKERPSYQTMEAKRRLAVRLYYQPSSRPNSCLSMTNPPTPTSFSRPSSRQTEYDYSRNTDSPNDLNTDRYSSMSAIDSKEGQNKIPNSIFDSLSKMHGRPLSRKSLREYRATQNTTPTFDSRNSTPLIPENYQSGRNSNLSTFSMRNSSRQSMVGTPVESQYSAKVRNGYLKKGDIYNPGGNLKRSTSCVSQIRTPSACRSEKLRSENPARGDTVSCSRKPFSCGRSVSKESINQRESVKVTASTLKMDETNYKDLNVLTKSVKAAVDVSRHKSFSRAERNKSPSVRSHTSNSQQERVRCHTSTSQLDKIMSPVCKVLPSNLNSGTKVIEKHRSSTSKINTLVSDTEKKPSEKSRVVRSEHGHLHRSKKVLPTTEEKVIITSEKNDVIKETLEVSTPVKKIKHRTKVINKECESIRPKTPKSMNGSTENLENHTKTRHSDTHGTSRVRNEVQIRIKPHVVTEISACKDSNEDCSKLSNSHITLKTPSSINIIESKPNTATIKEIEKVLTVYKQKDLKEDTIKSSRESKRFVTNCNLIKAQGDNSLTQSQTLTILKKDENDHAHSGTKNLYQCKSIRSVSISDQNSATKFRSSISLQDSLNRAEDVNISRVVKAKEVAYFCQDCGHKFPSRDAKFCCSCGCRRLDIPVNKSIECKPIKF